MGFNDIVTRLRQWAIATDAVPASDLMDEAAAEIERLRAKPCPYVTGSVTRHCTLTPLTLTLTDEEREAIDWAAYAAEKWYEHTAAATLRGLLERTKGTR